MRAASTDVAKVGVVVAASVVEVVAATVDVVVAGDDVEVEAVVVVSDELSPPQAAAMSTVAANKTVFRLMCSMLVGWTLLPWDSDPADNGTVERISIVGSPGAGKTWLAGQLAQRLSVDHIELDAIFHQPGWQPLADDLFTSRVTAAIDSLRWIVDGNYSRVARPIVWSRADTVVFLDLPKATVMRALLRRTVRRSWRREELWNGNRERFRNLVKSEKEDNILLWAWTQFDRYRQTYREAMSDPDYAHLEFVHLRSRADVAAWLSSVTNQV